jgi:hypothetical protein
MDKLTRARMMTFVTVAVLAIVLAANAPSEARGMQGQASAGGHSAGVVTHRGFEGRGFDEHRFEGHRFEHRGFGVPIVPDYETDAAPAYWYYCRSYDAYYPYVASCPDDWEPVEAS